MSINIIAHNLTAMNAQRMLGVNTKDKASSMEKLSSGYRINRAADDASGLAISEKMRRMIRGLNQGTENAQDGVSWVKTGDGALDEVHSILHRMTELTVKALNGTWTETDRAAMQIEIDQLQKEIDRLTDSATFNEKQIFAEHEIPYYQFEGNLKWLPNQKHMIIGGSNTLSITYQLTEGSVPQTATITVPPGQYTTKELMDEIDTALENAGLKDIGFSFEYTQYGTCNVNLEGGVLINEVTGGLAYLLYDVYEGGSTGALIGTTEFLSETARLPIREGINDHIEFDIESLDGTSKHVNLTIPPGSYTRSELINWLNENLADTSVEAVEYGLGIKLASDDSIITALKGNMFKVDDPEKGEIVSTSVFYDNIGYGTATVYPASLTGGGVLTSDFKDEEHSLFNITSSNNVLYVQPNGSSTVTRLEIPEGYYDANSMANTLNRLFRENNLGLEAEVYTDQNGYDGLIITSTVKGLESKVGIDPKSSAYNTLFVTRAYNQQEEPAVFERDTKSDEDAYYLGGKIFSSAGMPFVVEAGVNDKFNLSIDGKTYLITLKSGEYNSVDDLCMAINSAIKAAAAGLSEPDKSALESIETDNFSNRIQLRDTSNATRVEASAYTENGKVNEGFADIFTTNVTYTNTSATSRNGVTETNTSIDIPARISSANRRMDIYLDGEVHTIYLTEGEYDSYEDILAEINKQLPAGETIEVDITFSNVNQYGSGSDFTCDGVGTTNSPSDNVIYEGRGSSDLNQGQVGDFTNNKAASIEIPLSARPPFEITDDNNQLQITINGITKNITLTNGSYANVSALANMLQTCLNNSFGAGFGGVDVTANNTSNRLTLTARLYDNGVEQDGSGTNISCSTGSSSFLKEMNTTRTAASITTSHVLNSSITVQNNVNDTFEFTYVENGVSRKVTLKIGAGTYTRAQLVSQINQKLKEQNIGITAELNGTVLKMTSNVAGAGYEIHYDSTNGGTIANSMFANLDKKPAEATLNKDIQETIEIDASSNTFTVSVNGTSYTVKLEPGTYDRNTFISELNNKLKAAGAGVTAKLDNAGRKLVLTTDAVGADARIYMTYASGGTSMKKIFGTEEKIKPGIKASFNSNNRLELTAVDGDGNTVTTSNITVNSTYGSIFQRPIRSNPQTIPGTVHSGYHSTQYSCINGASLSGSTVTIDRWNRDLSFRFYNPFPSISLVSITLDDGEYTFDELQKALQEKLDAASSPGTFKVEVTKDGVNIYAGHSGGQYYFPSGYVSGGFYYNVMNKNRETRYDTTPRVTDGGYDSAVYAVGRKDIRHNITEITEGVNDTLSMDFTYGDTVVKISMTLDPGKYSGSELVKHIQKKLNEQLKALGLPENIIEAQIGGINTGVTGNNDNNALVFKLSEHVKLPEDDVEYKIDGIGGKAAFSVFYQTDGDMKIAYVTGTKYVADGLTIPQDSEFSFDVDGVHYTVTVPAGKYTADGILNKLNELFKDVGAPILADISNGSLRLNHTKYGEHHITNVSGRAKQYLFLQENGATQGEKDIWIQVGSETGDGLNIERPVVNTVSLGLNTLVITKEKYAEKALERIKAAVTEVSSIRSNFGSKQNRLEHTININSNTSENTQAAESAIRDADISKEVLQMSKANILENVGTAILTQANSDKENILNLLQ